MSLEPLDAEPAVEWTPLRGMVKAAVYGLIAATALAGINVGLSVVTNGMYSQSLVLFMVGAFLTTWVLFSVVHWAAGMVGGACTALVCVLATMVFVTMQLHLAMDLGPLKGGALVAGGRDVGQHVKGFETWFSPGALLLMVGTKSLMMGVCAWIRHDGSVDSSTLVEMARQQLSWI